MAAGSHPNETTFDKWDSSCSTPTDEYSEPGGAWKHDHIRLNTGKHIAEQGCTSELLYHRTVVCMALRSAMVSMAESTAHKVRLCPMLGDSGTPQREFRLLKIFH